MSMIPLAWGALYLLVLILGLTLFVGGFRGKRIGATPTCRRCRFDLVGIFPVPACPECGADLSVPRAVEQGLRQRGGYRLAGGLLLILIALAGSGAAWGGLSNFNWNTVKPDALLVWEARYRTGNASDDNVLKELVSRIFDKTLSEEHTAALVSHGLAAQADRSTAYSFVWGELISAARHVGRVDEPTWGTFLRQGLSLTVRAPRRIHAGEVFSAGLDINGNRMGQTAKEVPLERKAWLTSAAGTRFELEMEDGIMHPAPDGPAFLNYQLRSSAPVGDYTLHTEWTFDFTDHLNTTSSGFAGRTISDVTIPISVVPASTPLIALHADESLREALSKGIVITARTHAPRGNAVEVRYMLIDLPANIAFRATARPHGAAPNSPAIDLGTLAVRRKGGPLAKVHLGRPPKDFNAIALDITLTPDPQTAATCSDLDTIWDGELVFTNIPIEREHPDLVIPVEPEISSPPPPSPGTPVS